jgi:hypothetical protein
VDAGGFELEVEVAVVVEVEFPLLLAVVEEEELAVVDVVVGVVGVEVPVVLEALLPEELGGVELELLCGIELPEHPFNNRIHTSKPIKAADCRRTVESEASFCRKRGRR